MSNRHDKFRAYWERLGKPELEVCQDGFTWDTCRPNPIWLDYNDYRIKGDPHFELRRKWIESDFKLPIQLFIPSDEYGDDRWTDCSTYPSWLPSRQYREKPSGIISDLVENHGYKIKDEQLQEALEIMNAEVENAGWIPHTPGDSAPCAPFQRVDVKCKNGLELTAVRSEELHWSRCTNGASIIAWRPAKVETPTSELAENHPLFAIYLDAIHQATSGKGERHGGAATPFLEQRWHNISKSTGFRSLVYQACKKMEEACSKEDTEAWEREMLGGIVYAGMALIHSRLHGYTKETKVENDSKN